MATAGPLETPPRPDANGGLVAFLRARGGGIAWFALLVVITIGSLAGGGASAKAVVLGLAYGCTFGITLDWIDRLWHQLTGLGLHTWARTSREQAHVAVPFLIMLVALAAFTVQTRAHEGLTATWVFTGFYLVATVPRHQRGPADVDRRRAPTCGAHGLPAPAPPSPTSARGVLP
jgi:hypothetical protein